MNVLNQTLLNIKQCNLAAVKQMLRECPYLLHFHFEYEWPILHQCIARDCVDLELVKLFAANGGDFNWRTNSGCSLLFLAATRLQDENVANFIRRNGGGMSDFEEAALVIVKEDDEKRGQSSLGKLLDDNPKLIHDIGDNGFTLLHYALRHYRFSIAHQLINRGAPVNAITFSGESPLRLCSKTSDDGMACYQMLVSEGAKYTPREELTELIRSGKTDEAVGKFQSNSKLVNAWDPSIGPYLHVASWLGKDPRLVEFLLNHGADPNVVNERMETAMHVGYEHPTIINVLIEHGANINARDDVGFTPLHWAVGRNAPETAKLLVESGADVNAKTNEGETPLDVVNATRYLASKELAKILKAKGARSGKSIK